jgi:hypothetical protein
MKPVGIRGMGKNGRGIIQVWDGGDISEAVIRTDNTMTNRVIRSCD